LEASPHFRKHGTQQNLRYHVKKRPLLEKRQLTRCAWDSSPTEMLHPTSYWFNFFDSIQIYLIVRWYSCDIEPRDFVFFSNDIKSEMHQSLPNCTPGCPNAVLQHISSSLPWGIDLMHNAASLMPIISRKLIYINISPAKI
jgi:hypothetical protein